VAALAMLAAMPALAGEPARGRALVADLRGGMC
jgi:hypothetical protein